MVVDRLSKIWPEWKIEKQIGKGSFGVVYEATREENGITGKAAIKVISIPVDSSEVDSLRSEGLDENATRTYFQGVVNDFVNEIRMMESFKGIQNIVSVEDFKVVEKEDEIGWEIFIRMELLKPFNNYLQEKKMSEQDVIRLGSDICNALEICAQRKIIHRDIKPENIFVNDFGFFKLGDFGIARKMEHMTVGLSQKGTQNYMAPEIFAGNQYDERVDIYSLGIVLYRLLNGNRMPFIDTEDKLRDPNARREALDRRIRGDELPPPSEASPEMANLILRACAYDPDQRFANAAEMRNALIQIQAGTYQPMELDATMRVNHAATPASGLNATMRVRNAPQTANSQEGDVPVNTFGKKKAKWPVILAIFLALAVVGAGLTFAYLHIKEAMSNNSDVIPTETLVPTEEPEVTETPTPEPTATNAPVPTLTNPPTPTPPPPTITPTNTPTPTPTDMPTPMPPPPTVTPTNTPTPAPPTPTVTPTDTPTPAPPPPTITPTNTPTPTPTATPVPKRHSYNEDYICTECGHAYYTEGLTYKLHDLGTYYIVTGIGSAKGTELIIPTEYNGKPVREIASGAFKNQSLITKLVIPSTVKSIDSYAFGNMLSLKEIHFNAVECAVRYTNSYPFSKAGQEEDGIKLIIGSKVTQIPSLLFTGSSAADYANIASITFKGTEVTKIGSGAFRYCRKLKEITIPASVVTIDGSAFGGCESLASVNMENPYTWYSGSTVITGMEDPETAAGILTSKYVSKKLTRQ